MDNWLLNMLAAITDKDNYEDRVVARDEVSDYTIDTAYTSDYGYETAIWKGDNDIIIVERYSNKEESEIGHKKWCEFCKTSPKSVYSVQLDREKDFEDNEEVEWTI